MSTPRKTCYGEAELTKALELERKLLRAVIVRLMRGELHYDQVRRVCYDSTIELVRTPSGSAEEGALGVLVDEALESAHTLMDEMIERSGRDV